MSKNSRFLPFLLAMALGGSGPAEVWAAAPAGAKTQDKSLFHSLNDRLLALYRMTGRKEDAVNLQKESVQLEKEPIPDEIIQSRGEKLVALLEESGKGAEARLCRSRLQEAGFQVSAEPAAVPAPEPVAAPVAAPRPRPVPVAVPKPAPVEAPRPVPAPVKPVSQDQPAADAETAIPVARPSSAAVSAAAIPSPRRETPVRVVEEEKVIVEAEAAPVVVAPKPAPAQPRIIPARNRQRPSVTATPAAKPSDTSAPVVVVRSPRRVPVRIIDEETVIVEEEVTPPAEPKRAVVKVLRVQTPAAAPVTAPVPARPAKAQKITTTAGMLVPQPATPKKLSQPLFPKQTRSQTVMADPQPVKSVDLSPKQSNALRDLSTIKVSLEFRDVQLADLVRLLAGKANMNMVSKNQITGRTTVNFQDIPIGTALDTVLKTNGYTYEVRDSVVWVYRVGEEPLETRVFFLRHALAWEILPLVESSLQQLDSVDGDVPPVQPAPRPAASSGGAPATSGAPSTPGAAAPAGQAGGSAAGGTTGTGGSADAGGGAAAGSSSGSSDQGSGGSVSAAAPAAPRVSTSGRWSVQVDDRSNSLIVLAPQPKLNEIARLLEVFDVSMENRQMQERIFKLKYIDKNTLVKAIQMILPRFDAEKQMIEVRRVDGGSSGGSGSGGGSTGGSSAGGGSTGSGGGGSSGGGGMTGGGTGGGR